MGQHAPSGGDLEPKRLFAKRNLQEKCLCWPVSKSAATPELLSGAVVFGGFIRGDKPLQNQVFYCGSRHG
jgi:hypothetical protein